MRVGGYGGRGRYVAVSDVRVPLLLCGWTESMKDLQAKLQQDLDRKRKAGTAWGAPYTPKMRRRPLTTMERRFAAAEEAVSNAEAHIKQVSMCVCERESAGGPCVCTCVGGVLLCVAVLCVLY